MTNLGGWKWKQYFPFLITSISTAPVEQGSGQQIRLGVNVWWLKWVFLKNITAYLSKSKMCPVFAQFLPKSNKAEQPAHSRVENLSRLTD